MKRIVMAAAVALTVPAAASAQPGWAWAGDDGLADAAQLGPGRFALRGGELPYGTAEGLNAFFYPNGYDPQYGSEGRGISDADDFAAEYGCRPIWNGKYGRYVPACN